MGREDPGSHRRRGPEARAYRVKCPRAVALPPLRRAARRCQGLGTRSITCKRSCLSGQGWSSGQALRPATGRGPPSETAAGSAHKFPGCLRPNGRLLYLSDSAPTAAATAILGSHCGGRRGAGGLQRGQRAVRLRRLLGNGRAGARIRRSGRRSATGALGWSHVTAGVCGVTSGPLAWRRLHEQPETTYPRMPTGPWFRNARASAARGITTNPGMLCAPQRCSVSGGSGPVRKWIALPL